MIIIFKSTVTNSLPVTIIMNMVSYYSSQNLDEGDSTAVNLKCYRTKL